MSYSVEYNPELGKKYPPKMKLPRKFPLKITLFLLVAATVVALLGSGMLKSILPGDPEVTAAAFSSLVDRVGKGEAVPDAVHCFFRNVITGEVTE